eukprot:scaffold926_cov248-Pinguiococcus_pyrenoidosus.AAC.17
MRAPHWRKTPGALRNAGVSRSYLRARGKPRIRGFPAVFEGQMQLRLRGSRPFWRPFHRSFASEPVSVFDRHAKRRHRDFAATRMRARPATADSKLHNLKYEVASHLLDRLEDIKRDFPYALDVGCGLGHVREALRSVPGAGGIETLLQTDCSREMVRFCQESQSTAASGDLALRYLVADEEFLPFQDDSFDLVLSSMAMHWVNDLPGMLLQVRRCLKPDGAFLGAMLGQSTLDELRVSLLLAEQEVESGVSQHISPMTQMSDVAGLVWGAGFRLPVVDYDTYTLEFQDMYELMRELRHAGDGNAAIGRRAGMVVESAPLMDCFMGPCRRHFVPRATFDRAAEIYADKFGNANGTIRATFQVIYMIGWKEHESQQKPLKRGSATAKLRDVLEKDDEAK